MVEHAPQRLQAISFTHLPPQGRAAVCLTNTRTGVLHLMEVELLEVDLGLILLLATPLSTAGPATRQGINQVVLQHSRKYKVPQKKTTAKSAYMKKKERDAAISKALGREHGSMVGTSVLNGTKNSSTFSSSKLNASIQSSKSVSGLKHSSYVSSKTMPGDIRTSAYKSKDGAKTSGYKIPPGYKAPTGGYKVPPGGYKAPPGYKVPTGSYKPPPGGHKAPPGYKVPTGSGYKSAISGTSTATTTTGLAEKGKPYAVSKPYATKAGSIGALNIGNNIGPKKFSAASSSTSTAKVASPSSSSMQNTCKDSVKAINKVSKTGVERSSGLSPNSTLSAPLDALGAGAAEVFTSK